MGFSLCMKTNHCFNPSSYKSSVCLSNVLVNVLYSKRSLQNEALGKLN